MTSEKRPAPHAATSTGAMIGVPFEARDEVVVGLIGVGSRGSTLLRDLLQVRGARVAAVHDAVPDLTSRAADRAVELGHPRPVECASVAELVGLELDLVIVASPWDQHVPHAVAAMEAGKHVAVEVPATLDLQECWQLVETSERTGRHCVLLENCCYGATELQVLNLVRAGVLGELLHGEAAYFHDLRSMLMTSNHWRRHTHRDHDGNLYPTHGLGPVAGYLGLNRGDRLASIVSMSSPQRGLDLWRERHPDEVAESARDETFASGDINTSIIKTELGRTILLQHQVVGPRPYDRLNQIVGTEGIFTDYPARIFVEDHDDPEQRDEFVGLDRYAEFEHELWRTEGDTARSAGHGGMDYIMLFRLVQTIREGLVPDIDVYDAASWSAPAALSFESVARGGAPVEFPDFTGGRWRESRPGLP